jgi:cytochrome c-type biogenesis protein
VTPYALAVAAGAVAAVNPYGFALLPAYVALLVIGDDRPGRPSVAWRIAARRIAAIRAVVLSAAMTIGFVGLLGAVGLAGSGVADTIAPKAPWLGIALGAVLLGLGGWLAAGRELPSLRWRAGPTASESAPSMAVFGVASALASLGCAIGPYQAVVVSTARSGGTAQGIALFIAYAAGMAVVVGVVALAVALARTAALGRPRRAADPSHRRCGVLLLVSGGYVAWYGWYELRLLRGDLPNDPVIGIGGTLQQTAASAVDRIGAPPLAVVFGLLLIAVIAAAAARRRSA